MLHLYRQVDVLRLWLHSNRQMAHVHLQFANRLTPMNDLFCELFLAVPVGMVVTNVALLHLLDTPKSMYGCCLIVSWCIKRVL
jgi:hypothetical protein